MGTSGNSTGTQTVSGTSTTEANIPSWAKGPLKNFTGQAEDLVDAGVGFNPYPGQTYIPPSAQELAGLQQIEGIATAGNPFLSGINSATTNLLGNMGVTQEQRNAMSPLSGISTGANQITTGGGYQGLFNNLSGPTSSQNNLANVASGAEVGNSNPFLRDVIDQSADVIRENVGSIASGMGRYGSGTHQGVVGREIGDMASRTLSGQMNADLARRDAANAQIDAATNARAGAAMGALGGLAQTQGANIANQAGASSLLGNMFADGSNLTLQTGALAPSFRDFAFDDANRQIDVGAAYRGEANNELQSDIDRYNQAQMAPWQRLNMGNAITLGNVLPFFQNTTTTTNGTETTTVPNQNPSAIQQAFGAGIGGLGVLGNLGIFG